MKRIAGLLIVLALFTVGSVSAQPRGKRPMHDGMQPRMLKQFSEELKLSDEQHDKLDKMMVDFKVERIELDAEIEKESVILKSLMRDKDASDADVYRQIDKVADLKAESQKMMFTHRNAFRDLLTDSQKEKLDELKGERKEQFKERFQKRKDFKRSHRGAHWGNRGQCDGHGPKGFGQADFDGQGPHGPRGFGQGQGPGPRWQPEDDDMNDDVESDNYRDTLKR